MNYLGKRIEERREKLDMTERDLAEEAGISVNFVRALERGQRFPGLAVLDAIAKALRVQPGYLLDATHKSPADTVADSLVAFIRVRRLTIEDVKRLENVARAMFSARP